MNKSDGTQALRCVMAFVMLICSIVIGFVVELTIAGMDIIYWTFSDRGLWLVLWTIITYAIVIFLNKDAFFSKHIDLAIEDN